ncbi:MAG: c-type cytochrome biogenesis protein CcmI, partial [Asticcacaulis sp.]
ARKAFGEALKRDPKAQGARYYLATQAIAEGDVAGGKAALVALRDELPIEDPRRAALNAQISSAEFQGVSEAATALAGASAEDQQAMIKGMVEGLAARLAENPNDPEGWVRLVRAYGVLGDKARQGEALATAKARYKDKPDILKALDQAAS